MRDFESHSSWEDFQNRWLDYAQQVKEQWPEISFSDILATRGSRRHLCQRVAQTYGLYESEADRAVSIWQQTIKRQAQRNEPAAESSLA